MDDWYETGKARNYKGPRHSLCLGDILLHSVASVSADISGLAEIFPGEW